MNQTDWPPPTPPDQWVQLALETTGRLGSIAVLAGTRVLLTQNLDPTQRTAATLAPAIEAALQWCRNAECFPHFVSVADGPGSFTGLRIGVTTAKTLGYALGLPTVGVDSLAAIAAATFDDHRHCESLLVALDAYRNQTFSGSFSRADLLPPIDQIPGDWSPHPNSVRLADQATWHSELAQRSMDTQLTGDEKPLRDHLQQRLTRRCDAIGVGSLAIRAAVQGQWTDPLRLLPRYLKLSAAEEKANRGSP